MTQLRSVFKFQPKLQACLINDSAHIKVDSPHNIRVGTHITLIKMALNTFARRLGMDELDLDNPEYDQETADLVTTFKELHKPLPILNFANKIDNIVGKKTVAALDAELPVVSDDPDPFIP